MNTLNDTLFIPPLPYYTPSGLWDCVWRRIDSTRIGWRSAGVQQISAGDAQEALGGELAEPDMVEKRKKQNKTEN